MKALLLILVVGIAIAWVFGVHGILIDTVAGLVGAAVIAKIERAP